MIYIYKLNNRIWADLRKPEGARVVKKIHLDTPKKCRKVIARPGKDLPERVIALAERALSEFTPKDTLWNRVKKATNILRGRNG